MSRLQDTLGLSTRKLIGNGREFFFRAMRLIFNTRYELSTLRLFLSEIHTYISTERNVTSNINAVATTNTLYIGTHIQRKTSFTYSKSILKFCISIIGHYTTN